MSRPSLPSALVLGAAVGVFVGAGCGGEPAPPTVRVIGQAPPALVVGADAEDDVSLRLAFEDGDGDLGGGVMTVHDCRTTDGRLELPIPELASEAVRDRGQPISGELIALVPDVAAADGGPAPFCSRLGADASASSLVLCVELRDSAGNASDGACSEPIPVSAP